ncbi:serine threonine protein kinase CMGC group [Coemansia biformis]|uniref:Serine threonine protein kinase CMGC group n=1 Tax=Coemansia biformis TaxID=1286918 RepID=A0A9W7YID6_9FUNG|nr:serine threonine protein kinase CMGC group [Coemansia biformis]
MSQKADASCDDRDGHYIVVPGREFTPRFKIRRLLGQGTFGKVMECDDNAAGRLVAIKVIRAVPKYRDAAKIEIRVLQTLQRNDPSNVYQCMHVNETFDHRNHVCMVFDLLGPSVFDFLKENEFRPFSLHHVQLFAEQLLRSVAFLHSLNLVHTDLKPENILLESGEYDVVPFGSSQTIKTRMLRSTKIRLIDFGSATFNNEYHSQVVSTRHYRAPEIILNLGWSFPCDMWSIGCIILELLTGEALFQTHDNNEHLAMMEVVVGRAPMHIVRAVSQDLRAKFLRSDGSARYPVAEQPRQSQRGLRAMRPLSQLVNPATNPIYANLHDLLFRLLQYDPSARISAKEACEHPFFRYRVGPNGRLVPRPSPTPQQAQTPIHAQPPRQPEPLSTNVDLVSSPSDVSSHRSLRPSYPSAAPPQHPPPAAMVPPLNAYAYSNAGPSARAPLRVGDYSLASGGASGLSQQQPQAPPQALPALKAAIPGNFYREPPHPPNVMTPHSPYGKQEFAALPAAYYHYPSQHSRPHNDSSYAWQHANGAPAHAPYASGAVQSAVHAGYETASAPQPQSQPQSQPQPQQAGAGAGGGKRKAGADSGYFPDMTVPGEYGFPEEGVQLSPIAGGHTPRDSVLHSSQGLRGGYAPPAAPLAPAPQPPAATAPAGYGAGKGSYNLPPIATHTFRQPPLSLPLQHPYYQSRSHPYGYAAAGGVGSGMAPRLMPLDSNTTPTLTTGTTETATPTPGSTSAHLRSSLGMEGSGAAAIGVHKGAGRSLPALAGNTTPGNVTAISGDFARTSLAEPGAAHYHHPGGSLRGQPLPQAAHKFQLPSASPMLQQVPTRSSYYHHAHLPPAQTLLQPQPHPSALGYVHANHPHYHQFAPHPSANNTSY